MKKLSILGLCLMAVVSASAQKNLVKEVEGKAKGYNADYAAARNQLAPALTNPESKDMAQTWYVAGTIEYSDYDSKLGKEVAGEKVDKVAMGRNLIDGYKYFMTAMPLDSVLEVDKKTGAPKLNKDGSKKYKTKYSSDIVKKIAGHYNDYINAGQSFWDAKDYNNAYTAWDIYTRLPFQTELGKDRPASPGDTMIAEIDYFKGLAAWQAEKLDDALNAFDQALGLGYKNESIFDYALSVAAQANKEDKVIEIAKMANEACGDTTVKYLNIIINDKINREQYDEALALLQKAISVSPDNAELYDVLGILYHSQKNYDKAQENLEKAYSLNPNSAKIQLDLGRTIYAQGAVIDEANASLPTPEYNKVRAEQVDPILRKAIPFLEYALNDENTLSEAKRLLRSLYYSLNDDENLRRVEQM